MSYASHTRRPNPAALAGAIGIPAAFAALLVVGLAVKVVIEDKPPPLQGFTVKPIPIPPPPPDPVEPATSTSQPQTSTTSTITRPEVIPFDFATTPVESLPGVGELTGPIVGPVDFGIPTPTPSASPFDPVGAKPRGNPGRWVLDSDYRSNWLRQGLEGSASFTLGIDASGKVTGCTITRSTGHGVLDAATCALVTKRARFEPARDGTGKPVAGSFNGSITWNIPE
jgi:protein TonB